MTSIGFSEFKTLSAIARNHRCEELNCSKSFQRQESVKSISEILDIAAIYEFTAYRGKDTACLITEWNEVEYFIWLDL